MKKYQVKGKLFKDVNHLELILYRRRHMTLLWPVDCVTKKQILDQSSDIITYFKFKFRKFLIYFSTTLFSNITEKTETTTAANYNQFPYCPYQIIPKIGMVAFRK